MTQTNAELVLAARSGDRAAIRTIHDRYCGKLYDHCSAVLRDPDAAAGILLDTFMLAFVELHRLRDPRKLEPWLFALARDQMLYRPRSPIVPPSPDDRHVPLTTRARRLAWEAVAWFPRRDRIVLDLHLRQRCARRELADATGLSVPHSHSVVGRLESEANRLIGALLVGRLARECRALRHVAEHAFDPRVTMRRLAHHVDRCSRCQKARAELPAATDLIASVHREAEPPELRGEALERVHLVLRELESESETARQAIAVVPDPVPEADASGDDLGPAASGEADERTDTVFAGDEGDTDEPFEFDDYDLVLELTPPPIPLRRDGFPGPLFPERRRLLAGIVACVLGLAVLATVFDVRGLGSDSDALLASALTEEQEAVPVTTVPPPTTVPPETVAPDSLPPSVTSLARRYACIGPTQQRTDVLATVSDDRALESVDVVVTHDVLGSTRMRMTPSDGQYVAQVGPYDTDGTVTWTVEAADTSGNTFSRPGPPIAARATC
jgi:DNA-directed RNA polymerase specialized sigma24 family protein